MYIESICRISNSNESIKRKIYMEIGMVRKFTEDR